MAKKTKKFTVDLSDLIDIDQLNDKLDEKIKKGIAYDISYSYVKVSKTGKLTVIAKYDIEH
jgi:hypothetical protein